MRLAYIVSKHSYLKNGLIVHYRVSFNTSEQSRHVCTVLYSLQNMFLCRSLYDIQECVCNVPTFLLFTAVALYSTPEMHVQIKMLNMTPCWDLIKCKFTEQENPLYIMVICQKCILNVNNWCIKSVAIFSPLVILSIILMITYNN